MRAVENTTDRLVLRGGSPLFRPFFAGGLGLVVLGGLLLIVRPRLEPAPGGPRAAVATGAAATGDVRRPAAAPGLGLFLATLGTLLAIVPVVGRFPYRKEIVVDRPARQFTRRDRTLLRLREQTYPLDDVRGAGVDEARHVDGDPYFTVVLRPRSGDAVTLERFTDRSAAGLVARLIGDHLASDIPPAPDRVNPPPR